MKKFIVRLLLIAAGLLPVVVPTVVFALDLSRSDNDAAVISLNNGSMNVFGRYRLGTQLLINQKRAVRCTYDFAVLGGGIAAATLRASTTLSSEATTQPCILPKGAIVTAAYIDTVTALTSGGSATVALSTGQAGADLLAATAYTSFTGILAGIPVSTAATAIKMTADRNPTMTVATAALTAGKFYVLIEYMLSQTL